MNTGKIEKITTEQEEILNLIRQGYLQNEIAKIKGVSDATISNKIRKIDSQLVKEAKEEGRRVKQQQEQEEILDLIRQGYKQREIADIKEMTEFAISRKVKQINPDLLEAARAEGRKNRKTDSQLAKETKEEGRKARQQKEQEEILNLISQGYMKYEIADIKGVTPFTLSVKIKGIDQELLEAAEEEGIRVRKQKEQEEILNLIKQGYSQKKIAAIKKMTEATISRKVQEVNPDLLEAARMEGMKQMKKAREGKRRKKTQTIRTNAHKKGINVKENIEASDTKENKDKDDRGTRKSNVKKIEIKDNKKSRKRPKIDVNEILALREDGYSDTAIANIIGISSTTVWKIRSSNKVDYAEYIKEKIDSKTLTPEDVSKYRQIIEEKYDKVTYKEVVLLLNAYIKTKQLNEGAKFINILINNEDMQYLGIERINNLKKQIEDIRKKQIARRELRKDTKVEEVMRLTGLKEIEVLAIKREMAERLGREM